MNEIEALIPFDDLADLLLPMGSLNSPSELHGWLCGKLCGGARLEEADWLDQAWEFLDVVGGASTEAREAVAHLYVTTLAQFDDEQFGLQLLLPDDETDLDQRVQALGQWCHGFLSGFGSAGIDGESQFSANAADALRDLAAIVQAGLGDEDADEDDAEGDFIEIAEYVRMATLSLHADFGQIEFDRIGNEEESGDADNSTLH